MRMLASLFSVCVLAVAGCGDDSESADTTAVRTAESAPTTTEEVAVSNEEESEEPEAGTAAVGTTIVARSSRFGRMLFNSKRQAIYIFQRDRRNRTNCYGECAEEWPPVYTRAKPRAGTGVKRSLLGTIRRRGGRLQVTYNGKPLYYYAHERPGQVLCHNVNLNGGFWWVIGPNGKRRP